MYYSQIVISSGDSGAYREGAMLGVPSIYAGNRDMPANDIDPEGYAVETGPRR